MTTTVRSTSLEGTRTFVLNQRIRYAYSAPVTDLHQRLMTVPPAKYGSQRRRRWNLQVSGVDELITGVTSDPFFNVVLEATIPRVDHAVEFEVEVELSVEQVLPTHFNAADNSYLGHTHLTTPDRAIAELTSAVQHSGVAALCTAVHKSLDYEWGVTGVATTAAQALAGGRGVCQDYAHIMLAACRLAGLPARYVSGHLPGEGASHAWVEVMRPVGRNSQGSWIAEGWDPTHNRRIDSDYLVIAAGRDYADVAPMSGTFNGEGVSSTLSVEKQLRLI